MEARFSVLVLGIINRSERALPMRTDIRNKVIPVIPAAEMAMIFVIGSHVNEVYDPGGKREIRFAIVLDDYFSDK